MLTCLRTTTISTHSFMNLMMPNNIAKILLIYKVSLSSIKFTKSKNLKLRIFNHLNLKNQTYQMMRNLLLTVIPTNFPLKNTLRTQKQMIQRNKQKITTAQPWTIWLVLLTTTTTTMMQMTQMKSRHHRNCLRSNKTINPQNPCKLLQRSWNHHQKPQRKSQQHPKRF